MGNIEHETEKKDIGWIGSMPQKTKEVSAVQQLEDVFCQYECITCGKKFLTMDKYFSHKIGCDSHGVLKIEMAKE